MTPRLLVMDVDSTLITAEVIELLADRAGVRAQVAEITEAAMRGEVDFAESLARRVATLKGLPVSVFDEVLAEVQFSPDAVELFAELRSRGWRTALVSGGFMEVVTHLADRVGADYVRANGLEVHDGVLTGHTHGPVIDAGAKAQALREFAEQAGADLSGTVAVGDGANDLEMMALAGISIGYQAKPLVVERADFHIEGSLLQVLDLVS